MARVAVGQCRDGPGDPFRGGDVQQPCQRGAAVVAEHPGWTPRAWGVQQCLDPAVVEAVGRRADRDHVALQQVGDLGGGLAAVEQADALRPLPGVAVRSRRASSSRNSRR
ncbi:hypothetical protein GCM10018966_075720 [Streptomyces yanii]